jgi:hypothetical protein
MTVVAAVTTRTIAIYHVSWYLLSELV